MDFALLILVSCVMLLVCFCLLVVLVMFYVIGLLDYCYYDHLRRLYLFVVVCLNFVCLGLVFCVF